MENEIEERFKRIEKLQEKNEILSAQILDSILRLEQIVLRHERIIISHDLELEDIKTKLDELENRKRKIQ